MELFENFRQIQRFKSCFRHAQASLNRHNSFSLFLKRKASSPINFHYLPFFTTLLFLFVIRNVFQSIDFFVVVAIFPFFKVLSIFCVEMSAVVSLILHFSFRFSRSVFVFTAIFELFMFSFLNSGRTLVLDSESSRFRPIFQGLQCFFPSQQKFHFVHTARHSTN